MKALAAMWRSYERFGESDLARLGRAAEAELKAFFARNPHLAGWQDRLRIVALAQGGAEHYLRGRRGIWDLDVIVCFAEDPRLPRFSAAWSSPGTGVPPGSDAARATSRNTPAALPMSPSGSSPTGRARSPGCESGRPRAQRNSSIRSEARPRTRANRPYPAKPRNGRLGPGVAPSRLNTAVTVREGLASVAARCFARKADLVLSRADSVRMPVNGRMEQF